MPYARDQQTWDPRLVPSCTYSQGSPTREATTMKACPPQVQRSPSLPLLERNRAAKKHPALPKGVKWINKYIKAQLNKCIFWKKWETARDVISYQPQWPSLDCLSSVQLLSCVWFFATPCLLAINAGDGLKNLPASVFPEWGYWSQPLERTGWSLKS